MLRASSPSSTTSVATTAFSEVDSVDTVRGGSWWERSAPHLKLGVCLRNAPARQNVSTNFLEVETPISRSYPAQPGFGQEIVGRLTDLRFSPRYFTFGFGKVARRGRSACGASLRFRASARSRWATNYRAKTRSQGKWCTEPKNAALQVIATCRERSAGERRLEYRADASANASLEQNIRGHRGNKMY